MVTKWSDMDYEQEFYIPFDENQKAVRGALLVQLGVNLEHLDEKLFEPCEYYEKDGKMFSPQRVEKVFVSDIAGTCYRDYACETWIHTFARIKRADKYILNGAVTRGKYFKMLKAPVRIPYVSLIKSKEGKYYVDDNGNHRVTIYKLMANTDHLLFNAYAIQQYHGETFQFQNRDYLYWLNAVVREELEQ